MSEKLIAPNHSKITSASAAEHTLNQGQNNNAKISNKNFTILPVQCKLSIGAVDDPLEHEADVMADKVMRMPEQNFIQRKCHCEDEEKLQRKPLASFIQRKESSTGAKASDTVSNQIITSKGNGSNMDSNTQSFMQSRFGADFNNVKIHTGVEAIQMNRELNAKAFTVGSDIYFNKGQYNPGSSEGKHLLAHELTHTVQQDDSINKKIQRTPGDDSVEVDLMTVDPEEAEHLREQQHITLPSASIVWTLPSAALITRIQQVLTQNSQTPSGVRPSPISNPVFVLHDTAVAMGARAISNAAALARGPLGDGAAAFVPGTGSATVIRNNFFDQRRPTATEFEKGNDILPLQRRLTNARVVWQNTNNLVRQTAMQTVLSGLNLSAADIGSETTAAVNQLNDATGSSALVFSTGMWTVNEICNHVTANGISAVVNNPANQSRLLAACAILSPFFAVRNQRISSSVNIEIVQNQGSDCNPAGAPLAAYTSAQYTNVSLLYLQAILQAGRFPKITTHFLIDKIAGNHCDPRCFNLTLLYQTISSLLTFPASSTFGIIPQYGVRAADNVWWSDRVCGGSHP